MFVALIALFLPIASFSTAALAPLAESAIEDVGWPTHVWIQPELDWAQPLHPGPISKREIAALYDHPPRAAWCSPDGPTYQPTSAECDAYDDALEAWMLDFTDTTDPADLPQYTYPPTYCGSC